MLFIHPFSRIPVPIFSRCMRGHVASCCRKEGSMQKRKKKKGWEKPKANEINTGDRDVRSLSYRMVVFSHLLAVFHFTCIFEGYRFVAKCLSRADLAMLGAFISFCKFNPLLCAPFCFCFRFVYLCFLKFFLSSVRLTFVWLS